MTVAPSNAPASSTDCGISSSTLEVVVMIYLLYVARKYERSASLRMQLVAERYVWFDKVCQAVAPQAITLLYLETEKQEKELPGARQPES